MWQPVADVHVRRREAGRQKTGELLRRKVTYPDLEGEVAAVEEHDVAGQGVLAHPPLSPCSVPHPCLLLGSPSLDLPPGEEAQHVAHSLTLFKPLSPLLTPGPSPLHSHFLGPFLTPLLAKPPPFPPSSLHCSLPHGRQGKTDWCRQLDWSRAAGSGPEKPGGEGGKVGGLGALSLD